jgi:NitT/TauT family transport system substrate-binding protein
LDCDAFHRARLAEIVRRDLPFYDASIAAPSITAINSFAREMGVLASDVPYDQIVAMQSRHFW